MSRPECAGWLGVVWKVVFVVTVDEVRKSIMTCDNAGHGCVSNPRACQTELRLIIFIIV